MTLPMFVVGADALDHDEIELTGDEGRHAAVVLRVQPGDQILLTDGDGHGAGCIVRTTSRQSLVVDVHVRRYEPPAQPRMIVVQAIPKGDHAERAVDLLTQVGVDVIVPWAAGRNVVNWKGERSERSLRRWRATAQAASKQARRFRFPEIWDLRTSAEVSQLVSGAELALVLHEDGPGMSAPLEPPAKGDVVIVVGPEGGISNEELDTFTRAGGSALQLGPTVLRSSTAGLVGAAAVLSRSSRWS